MEYRNKSDKQISSAVIRRLPRYYRYLRDLKRNNVTRISSHELSEKMNITASQIRQDFNCFGGFGQQGYGYHVHSLYHEISHILGVDRNFRAVIIGMGNLGKALARNQLFEKRGVAIKGLFDVDPAVIGQTCGGVVIRPMDSVTEFCRENDIEIAVLTLPKNEASGAAEMLIKAGVKGFWNFSNMELSLSDPNVEIENIHLGDSLMTLCYAIAKDLDDNADN